MKYRIILILLFVINGLLVFAFDKGREDTTFVKKQRSDSLIVQRMREEGVTFSHNNKVTLLKSGQEKFDDMFAHIERAKHSVHLEYFNFRNDSIANLLFDILAKKASEGVEIKALFDSFGNTSNNKPLKRKKLEQLRERGIDIREFDPIHFPWINHVFHRDHRKIVVIDDSIAYTGGMNVADYYINGTPQVGEWRDMHCRIEGEEVNTLQNIFLKIWNKVIRDKDNIRRVRDVYKGRDIDEGVTVGIINREPRSTNKIMRRFYTSAIDFAQDSIQIVNPYLTLNRKLKRAIKNAIRRGVKVEIMVSTHSDIPLTPDCVFYNVHKLMKKGATIWMYEKGFHHTKVIMVDGQFTTVGSANLNARSLRFDYEENALIVDSITTKKLSLLFEKDKKDCFKLTPEKWKAFRTPWQRFRGWFAHLLAPWL